MKHSGEKTEKATPRRLLKARREGQLAFSRDFVSGLQFAVFVFLLAESGQTLLRTLTDATRAVLTQAFRSDLTSSTLVQILHQAFARTLFPLAAASGILVATGLAFQLTSTGFSISLQKLAPKSTNFNFLSKLKSAPQRGFTSAIQASALLLVFGTTLYWMVTNNAERLLLLPLPRLGNGLAAMGSFWMWGLWEGGGF